MEKHESRPSGDPAQAKTVRMLHGRLLDVMARDGDPLREAMPADPLA